MKRVIAACLYQTLRFQLKENIPHDEAVRLVRIEADSYKAGLERKRSKYKIDSEAEQPDGSIILKVRNQSLSTPVGEYMN